MTRGYPYEMSEAVGRQVLADNGRPCLFGVARPCWHPTCLEAHFNTLKAQWLKDHGLTEEECNGSNDSNIDRR